MTISSSREGKSMSDSIYVYYQGVLQDLEERKAPLEAKLKEIEALMEGIQKLMPAKPLYRVSVTSLERYKNMSMRWAILQHLTEFADSALPTAEIANGLSTNGFEPTGSFNSKVSAILSQMVTKNEVEKDGQNWMISDHGRVMWESIKHSEKYINRHVLSSLGMVTEGD
jgi:hypothetical protein